MKKIKLTQDKYALVDDEDFERVNQYKWYFEHGYACRDIHMGYKDLTKPKNNKNEIQKRIYMHRFIVNAGKGLDTDHINGNKLDNRKSNLRICTHQQNNSSSKKHKNNTSGYKGVTWDKENNKWRAQIMYAYKCIRLGRFLDKTDAAKAYNKKAKELFGEYAVLNNII